MKQIGLSTIGCFPDVVAAADGGWLVTWQTGHDVIVARLSLAGEVTILRAYDRVSDLAFPRLNRHGQVAYRALDSTLRANGVLMGQAEIGGNHPIAVSNLYIYAQHAPTNGVYRYPWDGSPPDGPVRYGAPTGLSRVTLDGTVRTMDEDRAAEPGMTCPAYTAHVVTGEHPDSGVLVRHDGLGTAHVGVGTLTFTPRVAYAQGHWCVVTHGDPWGVRAFILEDADFSLVQEPPTKPPEKPPQEPPVFTPTAPNLLHEVSMLALDHSQEFAEAHTGSAHTERFIRRLAWELWKVNPRFGLNGKRGSDTISQDAISYVNTASPAGGVEIIDVISAAGSPEAAPAWQDVTQATIDAGSVGKWIAPSMPDWDVQQPPDDEDDEDDQEPPVNAPPTTPPVDLHALVKGIEMLGVTVAELREAVRLLVDKEPPPVTVDLSSASWPVVVEGRLGTKLRLTGRVGKGAA